MIQSQECTLAPRLCLYRLRTVYTVSKNRTPNTFSNSSNNSGSISTDFGTRNRLPSHNKCTTWISFTIQSKFYLSSLYAVNQNNLYAWQARRRLVHSSVVT